MDTDYDNWAAVYACDEIVPGAIIEYGWVLTRSTEPTEDVVRKNIKSFCNNGNILGRGTYKHQKDIKCGHC